MDGQALMTQPISNVKDFFVKFISEEDGRVYEGTFSVKRLSVKAVAAVQVRKTQLNGGLYYDDKKPGAGIDENTDFTNYMIAHLEQSLIRKPTWWNLDDIADADLLLEVFKHVSEFEGSFRSPQRRAAIDLQSSQVDSGRTGEKPRAVGHVEMVGGGQVQVALDP